MTANDLVQEYLPATVKLLQTWDGMTLRNSLVISAAFKEAKRLGMTSVVVGDGADEILEGILSCGAVLTIWIYGRRNAMLYATNGHLLPQS
jgi:asparagine synthetase B (glutamine-hydrolysing)